AFGAVVDAGPVLEALGLPDGASHSDLRPQVVSTGLPTLIVPLADVTSLTPIRLDTHRLAAAMPVEEDGTRPLTCYVVAEAGPGEWRARSFGADLAGGEDPATGSAAGPLGAYLKANTGLERLTISQGVEM